MRLIIGNFGAFFPPEDRTLNVTDDMGDEITTMTANELWDIIQRKLNEENDRTDASGS